jgi:hypothetical protein
MASTSLAAFPSSIPMRIEKADAVVEVNEGRGSRDAGRIGSGEPREPRSLGSVSSKVHSISRGESTWTNKRQPYSDVPSIRIQVLYYDPENDRLQLDFLQ